MSDGNKQSLILQYFFRSARFGLGFVPIEPNGSAENSGRDVRMEI
jgi:hypothetical protein